MLHQTHAFATACKRCSSHQASARRGVHFKAKAVNAPGGAGEVVSWAQQQFLQEVSRDRPDSSISLAKVCILLALEEEAAKQLDASPSATARTSATASTWSLTRLDALAAEVVDTLTALDNAQQHATIPTPPSEQCAGASTSAADAAGQSGSAAAGSTAGVAGSGSSSDSSNGAHIRNSQQQSAAAGFAAVRQQAQRYPMQVLNAVNAVLFQRHGYSACNRFGASIDSQLSAVMEDGPGSVAALTILYLEVCSRLGLDCGVKVVEDGRYCLVWPRPQPAQATQQHQQQQQQQQQQHVLQQQQQQDQQVGQPAQTAALQQQTLLSVGGDACVVDVYGEGALLPVREACELFAISPEELLAGSSRRELLAALLQELQTAHWCSAVGCSPTPALMTPLSAATAVRQGVRQLHGASIERAAAAAAKRVVLLPQEPQAQLGLALLCYFSGRYEDAWLELGSYLETLRAAAAAERGLGTQGAGADGQQGVGGQQDAASGLGALSSSGGSAVAVPSSTEGTSSSSGNSSRASSRVTELHAAIQSMLIGGAAVPESLLPTAALTAAEAALASAEEDAGSRGNRQQEQQLGDIVLLFQKLQLELMMAENKES